MHVGIHAELTTGGQQIVLLAAGADHDVAAAAKVLQTLTPLFGKSDPPGALLCPLTWPAVVQLSATFGSAFVPGPQLCAWIEDQVRLRAPGRVEPGAYLGPGGGLTPYPWQVEGAQMIGDLGSALITDEPGTGKTITTILGLVTRSSYLHNFEGPVLVVCPASVVDPWVQAWRDWAPHVRAVAWRGTPAKRLDLFGTADVYVTSYETCRQDAPPSGGAAGKKLSPLTELGAGALVVDECHLIKNNQTARSQSVRRLAKKVTEKGGPVVALSGTPITHHPGDLWPTLDALAHHAWPAKGRWVDRYCLTLKGEYEDQVLGLAPHAEAEFRLTMLGQHRRVAKADVLTELPPKVYSVRTVDMPAKWRKVYDDFEAQMLAELPDGSELSVMDVLAKLTHLSALSSAPADVQVTHGPDVDEVSGQPKEHVHLELKPTSWKVDALLELLEERPEEQVVAFAPSRQLVVLAGQAAANAGRRVGYVIGGQSQKERSETVRAFQAGELDLICATTGAGGVGITLTAARTCVFLQRPWSLVDSIQAEDRCHRIGSEQHDSVEIVDIVARNTIDTRVRAVLRERAGQLSDLVQDPRIVTELLGGSSVTQPLERAS
jgi:SNF2 family DNA or RNA helicase